jgi:ABC-type lipoprotein export system ATPase subunit
MYRLTGVTKDYPKGRGVVHALRGVNVVIEDGGWLAIQGPTGHGKSTLLQILGALDRPTSGTVKLDGQDLTLLAELWRERGLTLVTVTHDSSVARRAQRTAIMRNGLLTVWDAAPARHLRA